MCLSTLTAQSGLYLWAAPSDLRALLKRQTTVLTVNEEDNRISENYSSDPAYPARSQSSGIWTTCLTSPAKREQATPTSEHTPRSLADALHKGQRKPSSATGTRPLRGRWQLKGAAGLPNPAPRWRTEVKVQVDPHKLLLIKTRDFVCSMKKNQIKGGITAAAANRCFQTPPGHTEPICHG